MPPGKNTYDDFKGVKLSDKYDYNPDRNKYAQEPPKAGAGKTAANKNADSSNKNDGSKNPNQKNDNDDDDDDDGLDSEDVDVEAAKTNHLKVGWS